MPRCPFASLAVLLLLVLPAVVRAQPKTDPPKEYEPAVQALDQFIAREVADKRLPALSIALVDDQKIVWARGFGFADAAKKKPATAETVYRVGSVSKLFTDLAVMQLVEQGKLDLDAPVTKYLPDFKPVNPFDKPITLRQLMSHRSGLVREPPVGNYFDPIGPSLDQHRRAASTGPSWSTRRGRRPSTPTPASPSSASSLRGDAEASRSPATCTARVLDPLGMTHSALRADAGRERRTWPRR